MGAKKGLMPTKLTVHMSGPYTDLLHIGGGTGILHINALSICPDKIFFVWDKIRFVQDKNFFHGFNRVFQKQKLFLSHGQDFCLGHNIFFPRKNYFVEDKSDFFWADGQGINNIESESKDKKIINLARILLCRSKS